MLYSTIVGIGSNLGDRFNNLKQAILLVNEAAHTKIIKKSYIYETMPQANKSKKPLEWYDLKFLNAAIACETSLEPLEFLDYLKDLEFKIEGRYKTTDEPRNIDLDILTFNNFVITSERLTIPHPFLHIRAFALIPLLDVDPEHMYIGSKSCNSLLKSCDISSVVKTNMKL